MKHYPHWFRRERRRSTPTERDKWEMKNAEENAKQRIEEEKLTREQEQERQRVLDQLHQLEATSMLLWEKVHR